jgi:hypothetical protein
VLLSDALALTRRFRDDQRAKLAAEAEARRRRDEAERQRQEADPAYRLRMAEQRIRELEAARQAPPAPSAN